MRVPGFGPGFGRRGATAHACSWTCQTPLHGVGATARRTTQNPAEAQWRWRGERSEPVRLSVHGHHSCSVCDGSRVQNRAVERTRALMQLVLTMRPAALRSTAKSGRSCKSVSRSSSAKGLRGRLAPTSGEIVTQIQLDSSRHGIRRFEIPTCPARQQSVSGAQRLARQADH